MTWKENQNHSIEETQYYPSTLCTHKQIHALTRHPRHVSIKPKHKHNHLCIDWIKPNTKYFTVYNWSKSKRSKYKVSMAIALNVKTKQTRTREKYKSLRRSWHTCENSLGLCVRVKWLYHLPLSPAPLHDLQLRYPFAVLQKWKCAMRCVTGDLLCISLLFFFSFLKNSD